MRRNWHLWSKAIHMWNTETDESDSICWVTGSKRNLSLTTDRDRVSCKFCLRILEREDELDESKETTP